MYIYISIYVSDLWMGKHIFYFSKFDLKLEHIHQCKNALEFTDGSFANYITNKTADGRGVEKPSGASRGVAAIHSPRGPAELGRQAPAT